MKKRILAIGILVALSIASYYMLSPYRQQSASATQVSEASATLHADSVSKPEPEPKVLYGMVVDSMLIIEDVIKPNQNLSHILSEYNISFGTIHNIALKSKEVFDVRRLAANKKYTLICDNDSARTAKAMVYEPSPLEYVVFDLQDSIRIYKEQRQVVTEERTMSGVIESSMYQTLMDEGASPALVSKLADVFAWQIDFFRIQKGDRFKVIYEQQLVEGEPVGLGRIIGAEFEHFGNTFFAFYYDQGNGVDYFDEEGNSLRKAFLKAPLNYSRISSRYSPRRFHPVQKRWKAHLGTDYAAPTGTPIKSVGDGIIVASTYNSGNGNYVKVKHNSVYTTQYLHMSKRAQGIRPGVKVKQGQIIGYVGSTGLATGPHLCFRFWKNGRQVDALRVELPPSEPISKEHAEAFAEVKRSLTQKLESISYPVKEEEKVLAKVQ
ncbi:peptidoglycan DD-metalloendopeptidase family protein [Roseivirga sp. BDSF3-8]|uniref:peptidoglycan DD-metalloendopeptidase family protein n=1 Tax=Roseivirga sp. BDSF3-8 TaxID=3241598 RepID=UPI0035324B41